MKKIIIVLIILLTSLNLFSQTKKQSELSHNGFFTRMTCGLGTTWISESVNLPNGARNEFNLDDISFNTNLYAGYFIVKNLSGYGKIGLNITSGKLYTNNLSSYGAGICYYFMPENMFVNFDISSGHDKIEFEKRVGGGTGESQRGLLFNIGLGKEWIISKHWGIGGMLYYFTGSIDDEPFENQTPEIKHTGFGLSFTTTFN